MAVQFLIDYIETSNTTISTRPLITWSFYDTGSVNPVQTGAQISLYNINTNETIVNAYEPQGNAAFQQSYKCPTLKPGYYRFALRVQGDFIINDVLTWSSEYSYYFYVIKWEEKEIRWESNDSSAYSFNKWFNFTNLDINTNSERIKLSSSGITYLTGDYVTEYRIQGETDVAWQNISISKSCPVDPSDPTNTTSISVFARASSVPLTELDTPSWVEIYDNNLIGLVGEYLQIKCTLNPDNTNTLTPLLNSLLITYLVPAKTSSDNTTIICNLEESYLHNNTEYKDGVIQLKAKETVYTYVSNGILSTIFDASNPVVFTSIDLNYNIPANTTLVIKSRLFNNPNNKPDYDLTSTTTLTSGTTYSYVLPYQSYDTGGAKLYRYAEIMFEFNASLDVTESPSITSLTLNYSDITDTSKYYFYSTNISFPSNISKIFYTGNDNLNDTAFCGIEYGITFKDSKVWEEDYIKYTKNTLIDAISVQSNNMRIGVKLTSNSLVYYPILHELGFIVETENGDKIYLNN